MNKILNVLLFWLMSLFIALALALVLSLGSCTSTKDVHKTETVTNTDKEKQLSDSLRVVTAERDIYKQQAEQSEYLITTYDTTPCPAILIPDCPAMLNKDSVQRLVTDLNNAIAGLNNKVKRYADGTVEYQGKIKSVSYSLTKTQLLLIQKDKVIDSLKLVKQKEKIVEKVITVEKEKHSKTSFLSQWWLFPAGMLFMLAIIYRKKIYSTFK